MRRRALLSLASVAAPLAVAGGCAGVALAFGSDPAGSRGAVAMGTTLRLADGTAIGEVELRPAGGVTEVDVDLAVPADGSAVALRAFHGLHLHANDDPTNGDGCIADPAEPPSTWFASADDHLKAGDETHGDHVGDMPPLLVNADGRAEATFTTDRLAVDQLDMLQGRAVVLHAGPDNLGNVPTGTADDRYAPNSQDAVDKTRATGNAGNRLACGVVHPS
jgi:Cu-Zn family superoxide dismutase